MNNEEKAKKGNILVLFCAGDPQKGSSFKEIEGDKYLGGEVRKSAAKVLMSRDLFERVIALGGSWEKIGDIVDFLRGSTDKEIIGLRSEPNTLGNIRALLMYVEQNENSSDINALNQRYHLLSNSYHMPRIKCFLSSEKKKIPKLQDWQPQFAEAEEVLELADFLKKYRDLLYPKQYKKTEFDEQIGTKKCEDGDYDNQDLEADKWKKFEAKKL